MPLFVSPPLPDPTFYYHTWKVNTNIPSCPKLSVGFLIISVIVKVKALSIWDKYTWNVYKMRKNYVLKCTGFKKPYEINQLAIFPLNIQSSLETFPFCLIMIITIL